jgi:hypothetical protein
LQRSGQRGNKGKSNHRRPEQARRVRRDQQQEGGERHQEQDHRQVIAERERVERKEHGEAAGRWPLGVAVERNQACCHQRQVESVDLGDDRLAPEAVRKRQQQTRHDPAGDRPGHRRHEV